MRLSRGLRQIQLVSETKRVTTLLAPGKDGKPTKPDQAGVLSKRIEAEGLRCTTVKVRGQESGAQVSLRSRRHKRDGEEVVESLGCVITRWQE